MRLKVLSHTTYTSILFVLRYLNVPALMVKQPFSTAQSTALATDGSARTTHVGARGEAVNPFFPSNLAATSAGSLSTSSFITKVMFMPLATVTEWNASSPRTMRTVVCATPSDGSKKAKARARNATTARPTLAQASRQPPSEAGWVLEQGSVCGAVIFSRVAEHLLVILLVIVYRHVLRHAVGIGLQ